MDSFPPLPRRLAIVAAFLLFLAALSIREYVVNVVPNLSKLQGASWWHVYDWRLSAVLAILLIAVFSGTLLLGPAIATALRSRVALSSKQTGWLLAAICAVLCGLTLLYTDRQFGAFDESITVDTLWRQALGQVAYKDFYTTNAPLFVLGLRLAAFLFGVNWLAQAWMQCCFSIITFLWTYWLLRRLHLSRPVSILFTLSTQMAGLVLLSFWWFNSVTAVISSIFLLSCLMLLHEETALSARVNFVASWMALAWVKPNAAGLFGIGAFLILLIGLRKRMQMIALTILGLLLSAALLNVWVPVAAVLQAYAGVAKSRAFVFLAFKINPFYTAEAFFELVCLGCVLLLTLPDLWKALTSRDWQTVSRNLLLLLGVGAGFFVLSSNGDLVDPGLPPLVLGIGLAAFWAQRWQGYLRLVTVALVLGLLCTQSYKAQIRLRQYLIGPYNSVTGTELVRNDFFRHMRTGPQMNETCDEIADVLRNNPGSIFFTSRLEWAYAAFGIPSPTGLPVFWQAGTSYPVSEEPGLIAAWKSRNYKTVVQPPHLNNGDEDWIAFPSELRAYIHDHYDIDPRYKHVVVWRRRNGL